MVYARANINSKRFKKAADMTDDELDPTRLMDFGGGQGGGGQGAYPNDFGSPSMAGAIPLQSMGTGGVRDSDFGGFKDSFADGDL